MLRTRFSFACSVVALAFSAIPAHAQSAPAPAAPAMGALPARINDIQVARTGDTISILVKLSQQPSAATVKSTGEALTLEIDGLNLNTLNLSPPAGSLVTRVEAASGKLTLSGVAFSNPTTVIYRNAVMLEAKLAEPSLPAATSLMGATIATKPTAPVAPQLVPTPVAVPAKVTQPVIPPVAPASAPIAEHPTATPIAPTPVAFKPVPVAPNAKPEDELPSHPTPAAPAPATAPVVALQTASIAGIDAARCAKSAEDLAKDAWALAAMGDHALCLVDAGKLDEAKNRLDQLAAITPQDWRVSLGRAMLAEKAGDMKTAQAAFVSASLAAPNDKIRVAISERISGTPENKETDIELPLPTAPAAKPVH
ncbi:MAG: hypothetical protein EON61_24830 [Alphaproteobacteria bacterium]|nr:MAG: hypothetical protein EON61_24830 [Alphaproteobacteria bacterium]